MLFHVLLIQDCIKQQKSFQICVVSIVLFQVLFIQDCSIVLKEWIANLSMMLLLWTVPSKNLLGIVLFLFV